MFFTKYWRKKVQDLQHEVANLRSVVTGVAKPNYPPGLLASMGAGILGGGNLVFKPDPKKAARNAKRRAQRAEAKRQKELAQFAAKAKRKR